MEGGVGDSVGRVVEEASPRGAVQPVGAPDALLFFIPRTEGKGAELFRFLINENYFAIHRRPNDLKAHDEVLGCRNLGQGIQGSGSSLDDQKTSHAAEKLESDRPVLVRVVPKGPTRVIVRDIDFYGIRRARFHLPENVVRDA